MELNLQRDEQNHSSTRILQRKNSRSIILIYAIKYNNFQSEVNKFVLSWPIGIQPNNVVTISNRIVAKIFLTYISILKHSKYAYPTMFKIYILQRRNVMYVYKYIKLKIK